MSSLAVVRYQGKASSPSWRAEDWTEHWTVRNIFYLPWRVICLPETPSQIFTIINNITIHIISDTAGSNDII